MYKLIGGDGLEYGPVTAEQLRQWIAEGRLNKQSRIQADGGEWKPLDEFPELQPLCADPAPSAGPPKTCGLAVASLVLGIISLLCNMFTAIPGLIIGCVGLRKINRSGGALAGKGIAVAGICTSGFFLVFHIFLIAAIVIPTFITAQDFGKAAGCMNNLKQLGLVFQLYAEENNGKLPDGASWCDAIQKHVPDTDVFRCRTSGTHYLFNRNLSGIELTRITRAEATVLLFEGNGGWNASGASTDLPAKPTHKGGCNVVFVDGHVERVAPASYKRLRWQTGN
jgi:prepilin-type processing-associated H-X9-DG protein